MIGKEAGLTDVEIAQIKQGSDASGWDSFDAVLLRIADEKADQYSSIVFSNAY